MAMIDYGAILFKNGIKQPQTNGFMDMESAVGWKDSKEHKADPENLISLNNNFFVYAGDEHFTIAIYKYRLIALVDKQPAADFWWNFHLPEPTKKVHYIPIFDKNGNKITTLRIRKLNKGHGLVLHCSFTYNDNHYNIIYGLGIDSDWNTWNKVKYAYHTKETVRNIDNLFYRISCIKNLSLARYYANGSF